MFIKSFQTILSIAPQSESEQPHPCRNTHYIINKFIVNPFQTLGEGLGEVSTPSAEGIGYLSQRFISLVLSFFRKKERTNTLQIVPEQAAVVRAIYADYLSGMGATAIAKKYRRLGMKISYQGVRGILLNEKYAGDLLLQKRYKKDHITKKEVRNKGELPKYHITESHGPIISRDTYLKTQEELKRRTRQITKPKSISPFTGLIQCGLCGKLYKRKHNSAGTKYEKLVWICPTFDMYGKDSCPSQQIPNDILESKVNEVLDGGLLSAIKEILIPARNRLVFHFTDGSSREIEWQHISRRESWSPEMREAARQKALTRRNKS